MRVVLFLFSALASAAICAWIAGRLAASGPPRRAPPRCRDAGLDEIEARLRAIEERNGVRRPAGDAVSERIDALERRLAPATPIREATAPIPATHDELVERARARGRVFDHWPDILAEEVAAWEAAAARATVSEDRIRAWTELERLYSMTGNYEAMNLVRLNILEGTGLRDESAWKRARLLANSEWGHGDIAVASSLFREIGKAPDLPKEVAVGFRMQAAQLAVAGRGPREAVRLHREFIRDYEGDPDPLVGQRVAAMRRGLVTLESRYPELNREVK